MPRENDFFKKGRELARKLAPGSKTLKSLNALDQAGLLTSSQQGLLQRVFLRAHAIAQNKPELARFEIPAGLEGELHVGTLPNGAPARLRVEDLAKGVLVVGATGSGKTFYLLTLVCALFSHLKSRPGGVWLVDHQKADMSLAVPLAERAGLKPVVVPARMPINPLEPPTGVAPRTWASRVLSMIAFVLNASEAALVYLRGILLNLYERVACPTWVELIQAVKSATDLLDAVKRPLVYKLEALAADLPELATTRHGIQIEALERRVVYWPLYQLPRDLARLLFGWARHASFVRRLESEHDEPDLFDIEDEIGFVYSGESGAGFLASLSAVGRGLHISFVGANQSYDLMLSILANTNSKFVGRLATNTDARIGADVLCLDAEQTEHLLSGLRPGQFIARLPDTNPPFAFTCLKPDIIPLVKAERHAAEERLLDELGTNVDREAMPAMPAADARKPARKTKPDSVRDDSYVPGADALAVLKNCYDEPFLFIAERAAACGLNSRRMNEGKKELLKRGMAIEKLIESGRTGSRPKLLEITEAGCTTLGLAKKPWVGRAGGFLHHYGKHVVGKYYQGFSIDFERPLGGGLFADVIATSGRTRVAIEIQVSLDHAEENLAKLHGLFDRVEFVAFTAPVQRQLELKFAKYADVQVHHISRYALRLHGFSSGHDVPHREGA